MLKLICCLNRYRGVILKYLPLNIESDSTIEFLEEDYKKSLRFGKLCLGDSFLFIKGFLKIFYIKYDNFDNFFRRVALIPTVGLKGKKQLPVEYLVICNNKTELAQIQLPGRKAAVDICERLKKLACGAQYGKIEEDS